MKLWKLNQLGRYVVLSDAEIMASLQPVKPQSQRPSSFKESFKESFKDIQDARGEMSAWGYYGLLIPWMIFGFCVSMTALITAIILMVILVFDMLVGLLKVIP